MVYNEKEKVDSKVDDVAEILSAKRIWKVLSFSNPCESSSLELVFIDEKGVKIHASIRKQLIYMFELKLETNLKLCESSNISQNGLTFTNIAEICAHTHDYEYLVDVIGVMTDISTEREYIRDGKVTKTVIIELTDHSVNVLCLGTMLNVPIVVIQFAKVKIFREKVSIQSVINTTRILVNPYIPEVETFKDSACDRHVFHVIPRFRVKLEVTNGKSTGVFVLFDSDMSYIMEKSCSFFVAQSKAKNSGPHPIEFDSFVGHKMLFVVDTSSKQPAVSDGSYRVKRVCMDPTINRSFGAKCPFLSPSKVISNVVDVDSDDDFYGTDDAHAEHEIC
ncbi:replication factor A protein [Trifolium repens]|nr:replication factor A protein [Trifolium repens]